MPFSGNLLLLRGLYSRLVRREKLYFNIEVCIFEQKSCLKDESCTRVFPSGQVFISLGYRRPNEGKFSTSLEKNLKLKRVLWALGTNLHQSMFKEKKEARKFDQFKLRWERSWLSSKATEICFVSLSFSFSQKKA